MFLKEVSFAHKDCTYLIKKYSKTHNIVNYLHFTTGYILYNCVCDE